MSDYIQGGPPKTREDFWLHFVCGFVLGGLAGFRVFGRHFVGDSVAVFLLTVLVCALGIGFLAGHYLDRFWDGLLGWLRRR
ncbi:MAG: hypothetical protein RL514_2983 [Verrucomicrobiota bacterium]|jgi:hypothetical protein